MTSTAAPARLSVAHLPGSTLSHVLRVVDGISVPVCPRITNVERMIPSVDAIATCPACVDHVTASELYQLVRAERRARRLETAVDIIAEVVSTRPAARLPEHTIPVFDETENGWRIHAGAFDIENRQVDEETACGISQPYLTAILDRGVMAKSGPGERYEGAHYCPTCWEVFEEDPSFSQGLLPQFARPVQLVLFQ